MKIGGRQIGLDSPPYVIAELGVNHDGSAERALSMVDAAKSAGVDAVKLQMFDAGMLMSRSARLAAYQAAAGATDPWAMLNSLHLSDEAMVRVIAAAHERGLHAIVTVFSVGLVERAAKMAWDAFKTASPDIIHRPLLEAVMGTGKPLIVSTGAAEMDEVVRAIGWLGAAREQKRLAVLQCVSSYPTKEEEAALGGIAAIAKAFDGPVGYSDHTSKKHSGGLAVAAGACVLEKHMTHDRRASGPDHAASLEPVEMKAYVDWAHKVWGMMGPRTKRVLSCEEDVRSVSRQSVTTTRAIRAGERIAPSDVTIKRPGVGIEPWKLEKVIGRKAARAIEPDVSVRDDDVEKEGK